MRLNLSVLLRDELTSKSSGVIKMPKNVLPKSDTVVTARINRKTEAVHGSALTLDLRGAITGRCCITELCEEDDWENMPLGKTKRVSTSEEEDDSVPDYG